MTESKTFLFHTPHVRLLLTPYSLTHGKEENTGSPKQLRKLSFYSEPRSPHLDSSHVEIFLMELLSPTNFSSTSLFQLPGSKSVDSAR
jgi:hypothetical protein